MTFMPASLPSMVDPAQKVQVSHFGTWACGAIFCFALQSSMCLNREGPGDYGERRPVQKKSRTNQDVQKVGLGLNLLQRSWGYS